jgi:hypothetical protein
MQILNVNGNCCFGLRQWNSIYIMLNDGRNFHQQVSYYESLMHDATIPSNLSVVLDTTAESHQF